LQLLDSLRITAYAEAAVKQPSINVEEKIDRFVGRRTQTPDGLKAGMQMQAAGLQFHRAFKHRWLAKGIHRFKTHEEADKWMIQMLVRSGMPKT
jgi:predicted transcriptional regulator